MTTPDPLRLASLPVELRRLADASVVTAAQASYYRECADVLDGLAALAQAASAPAAEPMYLVMAGDDGFSQQIVSASELDDAYLRTQWCTIDASDAERHAEALEHFHDDDQWTHNWDGERVEFGVSFEDGWVKVIRLFCSVRASAPIAASTEREAMDAKRWRWLVANSFDRLGATQAHVWWHTWEPHSATGEPTEWKQRVHGSHLDVLIDAAIAQEAKHDPL